jgi:hypothetical protein
MGDGAEERSSGRAAGYPEGRVRLVAWNCAGRHPDDAAALGALNADVLVLSECLASRMPSHVRSAWTGFPGAKGLGVAARAPWDVAAVVPGVDAPDQLLVSVSDGATRFDVLALWPVQRRGGPSYAETVADAVARHRGRLASGGTLIAGDLNCSVGLGRRDGRIFAETVEALRSIGLVSAYHELTGAAHGAEPDATLFWRWRDAEGSRFHIDFVFAPRTWLAGASVQVGGYDDWVASGASDHCPVVLDLDGALLCPGRARGGPRA